MVKHTAILATEKRLVHFATTGFPVNQDLQIHDPFRPHGYAHGHGHVLAFLVDDPGTGCITMPIAQTHTPVGVTQHLCHPLAQFATQGQQARLRLLIGKHLLQKIRLTQMTDLHLIGRQRCCQPEHQ